MARRPADLESKPKNTAVGKPGRAPAAKQTPTATAKAPAAKQAPAAKPVPAAKSAAPAGPKELPAAAKPSRSKPAPPAPKSGPAAPRAAAPDPALTAYAEALAALYRKDWSKAAELLQEVLDQGDVPELADRARQLLAATRQRAASEGAAPAKEEKEKDDPYLRALFEKNRGNFAAALEICQREGRDQKDERFAYLVAAIHAVERRTEEAARILAQAIELNPKNRIHAYHDPDFAEIRRNHRHVFGL